jgi:hypothetical protein
MTLLTSIILGFYDIVMPLLLLTLAFVLLGIKKLRTKKKLGIIMIILAYPISHVIMAILGIIEVLTIINIPTMLRILIALGFVIYAYIKWKVK